MVVLGFILLFACTDELARAAEDAVGGNPGAGLTKWTVETGSTQPAAGAAVGKSAGTGKSGRDQLEEFLNHRKDIRDNISKWSGQTDPVWILHEWIKITTERGDDYKVALYISDLLAQEKVGGTLPVPPGGSPAPVPGSGPDDPGPVTPPPSGAEPPRDLDPRLAQMDVRVVEANVRSGEKYWRLVKAKFESDINNESGGNHNIYIEPQFRAVVMWGGSHVDRVDKDYPIFAAGNAYDCKIGGPEPSDTVVGMGMMNPGNKGNKAHVNYRLWFQLVTKP